MIGLLEWKLREKSETTAEAFTRMISKMQECLREGECDKVLRLRDTEE